MSRIGLNSALGKRHMSQPSQEILSQFDILTLDPDRPLVISDADEVLLRFMVAMEEFLDREGLWIDLNHFALSGNIFSKETNEKVTRENLINDFFAVATRNIPAVDHAAESLSKLNERAQVIIFTNLPIAYKQERIENLRDHGMDYPVIVGSGLKGPAISWLHKKMRAPVFFLDDISHNIDSVGEHSPDTNRIHFIADPRLARLVGPAKKATQRIDCWKQAHDWIASELDRTGH